MADEADIAADQAEWRLRGRLSRVQADIPAGEPGECDDCGEIMPRLVGGRCGYCRDGRKPPLSRFDGPPPALPVTPPPPTSVRSPVKEQIAMTRPSSDNFQTISVPLEGAMLHRVRAYATKQDLPLGRSVVELLTDGCEALEEKAALAALPEQPETPAIVDLSTVPAEWLATEVARRLTATVSVADYQAAISRVADGEARAEAAEGQLARVRDLLSAA